MSNLDYPWLEPVWQQLIQTLAANRLPHGLLLTGYQGWGERYLAAKLATHLLQLDAPGQGSAHELQSLAHPDFRWLEPEKNIISVDEIRKVVEFAYGTPQIAPNKVVVIHNAHSMNANAANALLKTLEEPPDNTYIILASVRPGQLPATIRSRCQRFAIAPDQAIAKQWLTTNGPQGVTAAALDDLWYEQGGAPLALAAADESAAAELKSVRTILVSALGDSSPAHVDALLELAPLATTGRWLRYVQGAIAQDGKMPELQQTSPRALTGFADELLSARAQLELSNSANIRLIFERLLVLWHKLAH